MRQQEARNELNDPHYQPLYEYEYRNKHRNLHAEHQLRREMIGRIVQLLHN